MAASTAIGSLGGATVAEGPSGSNDFTGDGPYPLGGFRQAVELAVPAAKEGRAAVDVIVTHPTSPAASPLPLLVMFNGTACKAEWYAATAARVATWGYVVLQYDTRGGMAKDVVELEFLQPLLDWLRRDPRVSGLLGPQPALAVLGHSRGGKLAAIHLARREDVRTAVLMDPVDALPPGQSRADYPSGAEALAQAAGQGRALKAALIGAGVKSNILWVPMDSFSFNPGNEDYRKFAPGLAAGSWQAVLRYADHMDFARPPSWVRALFKGGTLHFSSTKRDLLMDATALAVAWLESVFRPGQSAIRLANFAKWRQERVERRDLAFAAE